MKDNMKKMVSDHNAMKSWHETAAKAAAEQMQDHVKAAALMKFLLIQKRRALVFQLLAQHLHQLLVLEKHPQQKKFLLTQKLLRRVTL